MATVTKNGKKYKEKATLVKESALYELDVALAKVKELGYAKFDETIEIVFNLGIDPKKGEQMVRGTVNMPAGLGKKIKIAIVTSGDNLKNAEAAGADIFGADDLIEQINGGFIDFDVLLATSDMMPKIGKLGKVLGRRGLMPTPKAGTVVTDVKKSIAEFKAGKADFKSEKNGIIHSIVGKKSFTVEQLKQNFMAFYDAIVKAKPATVKGVYIKSIYLAPTMGPSVKIDTSKI